MDLNAALRCSRTERQQDRPAKRHASAPPTFRANEALFSPTDYKDLPAVDRAFAQIELDRLARWPVERLAAPPRLPSPKAPPSPPGQGK